MSAEIIIEGFVQRVTTKQVGQSPLAIVEVKVGRKIKKDGVEAWENDCYRAEFWNADVDQTVGLNERDRVRISGMLVPSIYQSEGKPPKLDLKVKFCKVLPPRVKTDGAIAGRMGTKASDIDDSEIPF